MADLFSPKNMKYLRRRIAFLLHNSCVPDWATHFPQDKAKQRPRHENEVTVSNSVNNPCTNNQRWKRDTTE